jgi:hypothetical protein
MADAGLLRVAPIAVTFARAGIDAVLIHSGGQVARQRVWEMKDEEGPEIAKATMRLGQVKKQATARRSREEGGAAQVIVRVAVANYNTTAAAVCMGLQGLQ